MALSQDVVVAGNIAVVAKASKRPSCDGSPLVIRMSRWSPSVDFAFML